MNSEDPHIKLCILIVSYNVSALLRKCLQSLNGYLPSVNNKIVVVDNVSDDNSADMVRAEFPDCVVVETGKNIGFGRANNLGVKAVRADYYLVLNPDTEVTNDIIARMLDHIKAHPEAGVVGCRMLTPSGEIQRSIYTLPSLFTAINGILRLKRILDVKWLSRLVPFISRIPTVKEYLQSSNSAAEWERVESVPGSCFMINGDLWRKIGGFDENIFLYSEDSDLFYRILHLAGAEIHLLSDTGVLHHVGKSFKTKFTEMSPYKHWSTLYYFRKNHGLVPYITIAGFLFCTACVQFLFAYFSNFDDNQKKRKYLQDCVSVMKISILGLASFNPFPSVN